MTLEVPREMRLVVEPDVHGDPSDRLTREQAATCRLDTAPEQE